MAAHRLRSLAFVLAALAVAACDVVRPTVDLAADAPLTPAMCGGWPADPPLAFAGWTSPSVLGVPELVPNGVDRVFVLVTRDAIDQPALGAPTVFHGRGMCVLLPGGAVAVTTVPDDWAPR